jgi:glycerate 2-kinase
MTLASDARAIARAAIAAVDPARAVRRGLAVRGRSWRVGPSTEPLARHAQVHVLAFGKAAGAMASAASSVLGSRCGGGLVVVRRGDPPPSVPFDVLYGGHPLPDAGSLRAGDALLRYAAQVPRDDRVLFLVSGGGSAIAEVPAGSLSLPDLQGLDAALLASGLPIQSMNILRRHVSRFKGGHLGASVSAGGFATLALSDVVGDPPHDIASGPTVGDPTTFDDALAVLGRLTVSLPATVQRYLREGAKGRRPENPRPDDPRLRHGRFAFVATNRIALAAAAEAARSLGFRPWLLSSEITGETRDVGRVHGALLREAAQTGRGPMCLLSGGETTVTLPPSSAPGGRNQEFVVAAAPVLAGLPSVYLLSIGTDGIDGPTDAAGGAVDGRTAARARSLGMDLGTVLERHATYDALARLGGLVRTGPTGTNVMDLHVGLTRRPSRRGTGRSSRRSAVSASRRRRS